MGNRKRCRFLTVALIVLLAVSITGCQSVPVDGKIDTDYVRPEFYFLQNGAAIDRDGNPVDASSQFTVLYEIQSERPQAKTLSRIEDTGTRDEYGNPKVKHLTALYDLDGNLLSDWDEVSYESGFGDYVVRREVRQMDMMDEIKQGFPRGLWSLSEKKLVLPEAVSIAKYDDNSYLVADNLGRFMGRIDAKLNPIGEFPLKEIYYNPTTWGEYISVSKENPYQWLEEGKNLPSEQKDFLLTKEYQPVLERERLSATFYEACSEKLVLYAQEKEQGLYSLAENKEVAVFEDGTRVNYFDDELIMIRANKQNPDDPDDRFMSWLQTLDGTRLTEPYRAMDPVRKEYMSYGKKTPATEFIGVRDGRVELLDRQGKVKAQVELPGVVSAYTCGEVGFTYSIELMEEDGQSKRTNEWGGPMMRQGLLDLQLRVVVPAEKYEYVHQQYIWNGSRSERVELITGTYMLPNRQSPRSDVLDKSGKTIAERFTQVSVVGKDRLHVIQGFQEGLMNFKGEWVWKHSIFDAMEDE